MADGNAMLREAMEVLKKASTGMVIDALTMAGIEGGIEGIRPARGFEDDKIVGPAATVLFTPARPDAPNLNNYRAIRDSAEGSVLVIDGKGAAGHFAGDNQAECAKIQGLAAMVVYGAARDISGFRKIGMPLYCTSPATRNRPAHLRLTAYNVPIEVGGVQIRPGDIIVADEDGVVAIPIEALGTVLENMKRIAEFESALEKAIKSKASVEEIDTVLTMKKPRK